MEEPDLTDQSPTGDHVPLTTSLNPPSLTLSDKIRVTWSAFQDPLCSLDIAQARRLTGVVKR